MEIVSTENEKLYFGIITDIIPGKGSQRNSVTDICLNGVDAFGRATKDSCVLRCMNSSKGSTLSDRARRLKRGDIVAAKAVPLTEKYRCVDIKKSGFFSLSENWETSNDCVIIGTVADAFSNGNAFTVTIAAGIGNSLSFYRIGFFNSSLKKAVLIQTNDTVCIRVTHLTDCVYEDTVFHEAYGLNFEIIKAGYAGHAVISSTLKGHEELPLPVWKKDNDAIYCL